MAERVATRPNTYHLQNGRLHVTYGSSLDGKPYLRYEDGVHTLEFKDKDIRTQASEFGRLVTVNTMGSVDTGYTGVYLCDPGNSVAAD